MHPIRKKIEKILAPMKKPSDMQNNQENPHLHFQNKKEALLYDFAI